MSALYLANESPTLPSSTYPRVIILDKLESQNLLLNECRSEEPLSRCQAAPKFSKILPRCSNPSEKLPKSHPSPCSQRTEYPGADPPRHSCVLLCLLRIVHRDRNSLQPATIHVAFHKTFLGHREDCSRISSRFYSDGTRSRVRILDTPHMVLLSI